VTDLTPEELRTARISEAKRRYGLDMRRTGYEYLADLYETNWTPPPKVDPDLLAAREFCARELPNLAEGFRRGDYDAGSYQLRAFIAGIKHGRGS